MGEEIGKFIWGVAKGCIQGAIIGDFDNHFQEECSDHPAESFGQHVGHAIGSTFRDIFGGSN
jgi:hypothetical protein